MDLIDTNLVSELRKVRSGEAQQPVPLGDHPSRTGAGGAAGRKAGPNPGSPAAPLAPASRGAGLFGAHLAVDAAVARRSAALHGPDPKPFRDGLIAATALVHSLVVVTRNLADFEATGVPLLIPWRRGRAGQPDGDQRLRTPTVLLLCLWAWRGLLAALWAGAEECCRVAAGESNVFLLPS